VKLYWYDAIEDKFKRPGTIWIFGKALLPSKQHASCCVKVVNQERTIYVLPRQYRVTSLRDESSVTTEEVTPLMIHQELTAEFTKRDIKGFKLKQVSKKFCFDQIGDLYATLALTFALRDPYS
jgi:DNA polymerase alpha subunit A